LAIVRAHLAQTHQPLATRTIRRDVRISTTFPCRPDDPMAGMIAHVVVLALRAFFVAILAQCVWSGLAVRVWSGRISLAYRPDKHVLPTTHFVRITVVFVLASHARL
jgi:hypothetical protein